MLAARDHICNTIHRKCTLSKSVILISEFTEKLWKEAIAEYKRALVTLPMRILDFYMTSEMSEVWT